MLGMSTCQCALNALKPCPCNAGDTGFGGSYAHARAFYRAAVEALALALPPRSAASGGGSSGGGGGSGGGEASPEACESSTARVLRGWALMESDLRCENRLD